MIKDRIKRDAADTITRVLSNPSKEYKNPQRTTVNSIVITKDERRANRYDLLSLMAIAGKIGTVHR
jgi:hypothetical protein